MNLTADAEVSEGGTITYTATIEGANAPQNDVTVTLSNGATITIDAGTLTGSVTVDAPADTVYVDGQTLSVTASVDANDGNYENLVVGTGSTQTPVTTTITDTPDTVTVNLTGNTFINEGDIATYHLSLSNPADTDMQVTIVTGYIVNEADSSDFTPITQTLTIKAGDSIPKDINGNEIVITVQTTPDSLVEANEDFKVYVSNYSGGNFEAVDFSAASVTTTIVDNDQAPTSTPIPNQNDEDAEVISFDVSTNFTDTDALTYSATGLPTGLTIDSVTGIIFGTIDNSASQGGVNGVYSVTITATDGVNTPTSQTFNWSVVNPAPTAENDYALVYEDETVSSIDGVLKNDNDPDGDSLTVTAIRTGTESGTGVNGTVGSAIVGTYGTLTLNSDGSYSYVADQAASNVLAAGVVVTDTFTYTVSDGEGGFDNAELIIQVTGTNDAPTTQPSNITTNEDTAYTYSLSDFNYSDVDAGDTITAIRIDSLPVLGDLYYNSSLVTTAGLEISAANIGLLTFMPDLHDSGSDEYIDNIGNSTSIGDQAASYATFNFSVKDSANEWSNSSTLTVDVNAVADAPTLSVGASTSVVETITIANVTDTTKGYSVKAYDEYGVLTTISLYGTAGSTSVNGFGVTGDVQGGSDRGDVNEISYDTTLNKSETVVVKFDTVVSSIDVAFSWKHSNGAGETATITFFKDGVQVGNVLTDNGGTDGNDPAKPFQPSNGGTFDEVVFGALGAGDDYLIHSITYEKVESSFSSIVADEGQDIALNITSALVDTDGSESLALVLQDIPAGAIISDGVHTFTADATNTSIDITLWNLNALTFNMPNIDTNQTTYTLNVVATSTEYSNGHQASTTLPIEITVQDRDYVALSNDTAAVEESAMSTGTDSGNVLTPSISSIATGNILENDLIGSNFSLSNISIADGVTDTSVAGQIRVTTAEGNTLVVNSDANSANYGDYVYTLNNAFDHFEVVQTGNSITLANDTFTGSLDGWEKSASNDQVELNNGRMFINRDDTAVKTFDFGAAYAGKTVIISFDFQTVGGWDTSGNGRDYLEVRSDGVLIHNQSYTNTTSSVNNLSMLLDQNGRAQISITPNTTHNDEDLYVDNFIITGPEMRTITSDTFVDSFIYTVSDGNGTSHNANFAVTIHDDAPVVNNETSVTISLIENPTTNMILTLDVSGSMRTLVSGVSRFEIAKAALVDTIGAYENQGAANVNLTLFSTQGLNLDWMNAADAIAYINLLSMDSNGTIYYNGTVISELRDGWTNYEAAISVTQETYATNTPIADKTVAYFISDGEPTKEYNDSTATVGDVTSRNTQDGVDGSYIDNNYLAQWNTFVNSNNISLEVIGISSGVDETYLNMVQVVLGKTAILVTDETQLSAVMLSSVESVEGSLYGNDSNAGILFGADGGNILQITYSGTTYSYDEANPVQTIALSQGNMDLNFETGNYIYTPTTSNREDVVENFVISVTDSDGDTTLNQNLQLTIGTDSSYIYDGVNAVDGGAGFDTLLVEGGININFSDTINITNIEEINMDNGAANTITNLTLDQVLNMTDASNTLIIQGDASDSVGAIDTAGWSKNTAHVDSSATDGLNEYVYTKDGSGDSITLKVDDQIDSTGL